jgi:hypothetical protein
LIAAGIGYGIYYLNTCVFLQHCPVKESLVRYGISASYWTKYSYYDIGDTIKVRLTFKNVTSKTILLEDLPGKPAFDVCYPNEDLQEICRSREDPDFASDRFELAPGKSVEFELETKCTQADSYDYTLFLNIHLPATTSRFMFRQTVNCGILYY